MVFQMDILDAGSSDYKAELRRNDALEAGSYGGALTRSLGLQEVQPGHPKEVSPGCSFGRQCES